MNPSKSCSECGKSLPADAPRGLCPSCLMEAAYSSTIVPGPAIGKRSGGRNEPIPVDFDGFLQILGEMQLVTDASLDPLLNRAGGDATRLARSLVQAGLLTGYQAGAVLQGKAHGLAIGDYLVLEKLGVGGMGLVFKAKHRPSARIVALKMLPPSFGRDREAVARFRREFAIASRLSHPNIVSAIEANEDRGVHFLTMDFIEGYDLDRLVAEGGPMAIKLALHCVIQAARGLEAAHAQGVIHRDVKPGNIMIDASGSVRLLDLGLARVIEATSHLGKGGDTLTQTGTYMGTVDFLAPEQADDAKRADHRADIYSLGCTFYFLLTGKPPFDGETVLKRLMAHQNHPAPSLRAARPEVSEAIEEIYQQMMEKRPEDRPRSISEVVIELEACRSSPREAGDASGDLKTFARTVMKRAQPRGRRGPDDSVYARPARTSGLKFDPDLRLEDLVSDYRDEIHHEPLSEEKLPPIAFRPTPRPKRRRRNPAASFFWGAGAALGLVVACIFFLSRDRPGGGPSTSKAIAVSRPESEPTPLADLAVNDAKKPARDLANDSFRPIFNGKDLSGWTLVKGDNSDFAVKDDLLVSRGPRGNGQRALLVTERTYGDYVLRLQFSSAGRSAFGVIPRGTLQSYGQDADINVTPTGDIPVSLYWGKVGNDPRFLRPEVAADLRPQGEWNDLEVECRDQFLFVSINGRRLLQADLDDLNNRLDSHHNLGRRISQIGLQAHSNQVRFRKIEVREPRTPLGGVAIATTSDTRSFGGKRYKVFAEDLTWHAAKTKCEELGGHLAIIKSADENRFVTSLVSAAGLESAWLGATDEVREGRWLWVDGSPLSFSAWDSLGSQPNNASPGEHYLLSVAGREGKWSDQPDRATAKWHPGFVCQWDDAGDSVAAAPAKGRVLYFDNFDNPRSGWPSSSSQEYSRGYADGHYRIDSLRAETWWYAGPPVKPPAEVTCEIVGRIWGDKPESAGFLIVNAEFEEPGEYCRVRLHANGEVSLGTKSESLGNFQADQSHARTGPNEWNSVVLQIRKRTVEIFVNGFQLGEAVELPFKSTLKSVNIGNSCKVPNLRAELDRFEFREVPAGP